MDSNNGKKITEVALAVKTPVVLPAVTTEEAKTLWKRYQGLKEALIDTNDEVMIKGNRYLKKSYWRKVATFFNLTDEIISADKELLPGGAFVWRVVAKVTAPNGRSAVGIGACSSKERAFAHLDHDVEATAHTRAKNRAISDLVGGGEVSAEEINAEVVEKEAEENKYQEMLDRFANAKKYFVQKTGQVEGEKLYYNILNSYGLNHANELKGSGAVERGEKILIELRKIKADLEKPKTVSKKEA
jgi:hypothetical protein